MTTIQSTKLASILAALNASLTELEALHGELLPKSRDGRTIEEAIGALMDAVSELEDIEG